MTREDYKVIAEAFRVAVIHDDMWRRLRNKIADVLVSDNAQFIREKFYQGCEEIQK